MLGDTASGGRGGAATANPHYQQHHHQQHNPNNPPPFSAPAEAGHVGSSSGGEEDRFGGGSGNRWPRQETVALLRIRTDMDATFRDASVKGPLWDDVSRKMAELGYHRSSKKCKEKFENVYKYHKRTKDGRTAKHDGKTYRFFQELEAFDSHLSAAAPPRQQPPPPQHKPAVQLQIQSVNQATAPPPPHPPQQQQHKPAVQLQIPAVNPAPTPSHPHTTVSSTTAAAAATTVLPPQTPAAINTTAAAAINTTAAAAAPAIPPNQTQYPASFSDLMSNSNSTSSSTSTSSEAEIRGGGRNKRKRKWKDLFERLLTEVVNKQEEMQRKFLEAIEKREKERISREEYWRNQEMARINREREILAQERSIAASKDAAVMSFLQKISDQQIPIPIPIPAAVTTKSPPPPPPQIQLPLAIQATPPPPPAQPQPPTPPSTAPPPAPLPPQSMAVTEHQVRNQPQSDNNVSSSRWPKVEIEALIDLRKNLDSKYQENGPKGPLWEEISSRMKRIGYNRSAKRCKEKWENINKYFKKVKESNKKRPEDSKTCPYFHQLDALYRERQINSAPILVQPEQQWPPQQAASSLQPAAPPPPPHPVSQQRPDAVMEDMESDEDEYDEDEEDEDGGYELVANKATTTMNMNTT